MRASLTIVVSSLIVCLLAVDPCPADVFAAQTGVSTISPCPSFCGGSGAVTEFDNDGGVGFSASFSSIQTGINGTGRASAAITGAGLSLPQLRVEAFANSNARVSASAATMQKYIYNGPTDDFTLEVTLDGSASSGNQTNDATLTTHVMAVFAPDIEFYSDYGTFAFESVPGTPGASILDEIDINFIGLVDQGVQSPSDSLNFTLNDGDAVYLWANLAASAARTGQVDAFNTLSMTFTQGNVAGLTAVPEPNSLAILMIGFAGLIGTRRNRRRCQHEHA